MSTLIIAFIGMTVACSLLWHNQPSKRDTSEHAKNTTVDCKTSEK